MKHKGMFSIIGMFVVLFSIMITACDDTYQTVEYTKEDITLKFQNESGVKCYVEIGGRSVNNVVLHLYGTSPGWSNDVPFPTVLKTEILVGEKKSITVKDVVVLANKSTSRREMMYYPEFSVWVSDTNDKRGKKVFRSESKTQYTGGTFHIKLKNNDTFDIDFIN